MKKIQVPTSIINQPVFSFSLHLFCMCAYKEKESILSSGTHRREEKKRNERKREGEKKDSLTEEASDGGKSEFHLH